MVGEISVEAVTRTGDRPFILPNHNPSAINVNNLIIPMKVVFLGTGEAFDEDLPNNSILVLSKTKLLLDCGYSIPRQLWKYNSDPNFLDAIYISHAHADHYFGLPVILGRMFEEQREKPLTIICHKGLKEIIIKILDLGYKGFREKYKFELDIKELDEGDELDLNELKVSIAYTDHAVSNAAVRIENGGKVICYGGDGIFSEKTEGLYKDCDLLVHEAYQYKESLWGHNSYKDTIEMATKNGIKNLALTHFHRDFKKEYLATITEEIKHEKDINVFIPKPLEEFPFSSSIKS